MPSSRSARRNTTPRSASSSRPSVGRCGRAALVPGATGRAARQARARARAAASAARRRRRAAPIADAASVAPSAATSARDTIRRGRRTREMQDRFARMSRHSTEGAREHRPGGLVPVTAADRLHELDAWLATALPGPRVRHRARVRRRELPPLLPRHARRPRHGARTLIAMDAPPPMEDCRPFVHVARLLARRRRRTRRACSPQDLERGFLLLTDLGDTTYLQALDDASAPRALPRRDRRAGALAAGVARGRAAALRRGAAAPRARPLPRLVRREAPRRRARRRAARRRSSRRSRSCSTTTSRSRASTCTATTIRAT